MRTLNNRCVEQHLKAHVFHFDGETNVDHNRQVFAIPSLSGLHELQGLQGTDSSKSKAAHKLREQLVAADGFSELHVDVEVHEVAVQLLRHLHLGQRLEFVGRDLVNVLGLNFQ